MKIRHPLPFPYALDSWEVHAEVVAARKREIKEARKDLTRLLKQ